jgi:hypothetical protein
MGWGRRDERRPTFLYVLRILLSAYVPKNTPDSREMEAAFKVLGGKAEEVPR